MASPERNLTKNWSRTLLAAAKAHLFFIIPAAAVPALSHFVHIEYPRLLQTLVVLIPGLVIWSWCVWRLRDGTMVTGDFFDND